MPRGLSDVQNTYLAADSQLPITLIHIAVNGGSDLFYTDCPYDIDYDGDTYEAQGDFLGIGATSEKHDLQITNIQLQISALDVNNVVTLANSNQINQDVKVYKSFLDPLTGGVIGDSAGDQALLIFEGRISGYAIENAQDTANIQIEVASQFVNFERKNTRKTNDANFRREHPQDRSMEYSHETLNDVRWGKK